MKKYTLLIWLFLSFLFGVSTGYYNHFPFSVLWDVKLLLSKEDYESKRNYDTSIHKETAIKISDSTGVYITYGQSNAVSSGQIGYDVKSEVYQFFKNKVYVYKDPSLGCASGVKDGGSVWGMVGDKLIERSVHDKVIFSNCGYTGRKLEELNKGYFFDYLLSVYKELSKEFGRVDGILYHQGESNNGQSENYYDDFVEFIEKLRENKISAPVYLSRVSYCGYHLPKDEKLIKIQNRLIKDLEQVFEGPNTDVLDKKEYRLPDYCHFSLLGFDAFADMWVASIKKNR